jgi:hypothetical protein
MLSPSFVSDYPPVNHKYIEAPINITPTRNNTIGPSDGIRIVFMIATPRTICPTEHCHNQAAMTFCLSKEEARPQPLPISARCAPTP